MAPQPSNRAGTPRLGWGNVKSPPLRMREGIRIVMMQGVATVIHSSPPPPESPQVVQLPRADTPVRRTTWGDTPLAPHMPGSIHLVSLDVN